MHLALMFSYPEDGATVDSMLGQMIACATITDWPLNVTDGEPYSL